jgi:heat shock protein HtpX
VFRSYGLRTYIWNNRLKSLVLLAGFPLLLFLICFAFALLISAWNASDVGEGIAEAASITPGLIPVAVIGALIWFVIAWFANGKIVALATGAHEVDRASEPRLWNILETLCISRGITMPRLAIIDSDVRNAFSSGVHKGQYAVTVTRGLLNTLNDQELETVLAHELTHIENRDVQLLVIAAVFVGIISLAGDIIIRGPRFFLFNTGRAGGYGGGYGGGGGGFSSGSGGGSRRSSNSKGGGAGVVIILILIAVAIFLVARLLAIVLRMAMSRKREYLADAGAVELTKNPDAMISALQKIAGHSEMQAPAQVQEMFLDHPAAHGLTGLFDTHPSIADRIAAIVRYEGGHEPVTTDAAPAPTPGPAAQPVASQSGPAVAPHPWGEPAADPPVPHPWGEPRN